MISERSYAPITRATLDRLALLCREAMDAFFARNPRWTAYRARLLCTALAQGAALHFLDGKNGVKDFDCWAFYELDERIGPLPPRGRRAILDFGPSEFGRHPNGHLQKPCREAGRGRDGAPLGVSQRSGIGDADRAAGPCSSAMRWRGAQ